MNDNSSYFERAVINTTRVVDEQKPRRRHSLARHRRRALAKMREEVDLIEEIDVNSVECLNSVRPRPRPRPRPRARGRGRDAPLFARSLARASFSFIHSPPTRARSRVETHPRRRHLTTSSSSPSVPPRHQATGKDWGNCVKQGYREDARLLLTSDDDEQIIMTLPFKQLVNLTSLVVVGPDDDTRPKTVKLFVNKPNLSFDNCGKKPVATIALTDAQSRGGERVELEYTDFQNVRRVHVYAGSRTTASAR